MSIKFINRNRSQGDYGMPIMFNPKQITNLKTSKQSWMDRSKLPNDNFHKQSTKYGGKFEYGNKYVGVGWTLNDATGLIKHEDHDSKKRITNAEMGKWKAFNSFEGVNHKERTNEALKHEISNITT